MKIKIDKEKIQSFVKSNLRYLPSLIIGVIVVVFIILTFLVLYPRQDSDHVTEGETRLESLNIRFNTKLLKELSATKTPTQLGTAGGRDPFSGF